MYRCYGPQSNYADAGLWMIPLQNAGVLDIREITACRSGGSVMHRHTPTRSFCSIASVIISAIASFATRPTNLRGASVTRTVAAASGSALVS